jgi:hypothetical protein
LNETERKGRESERERKEKKNFNKGGLVKDHLPNSHTMFMKLHDKIAHKENIYYSTTQEEKGRRKEGNCLKAILRFLIHKLW